jgi:hypothetical protein
MIYQAARLATEERVAFTLPPAAAVYQGESVKETSMDWFRSYHGAPTDAKFLMLAKRAGVAVHEVAFVWWALLDFASQNDPRGSIKGFDPEALACFSGLDESKIRAIVGVCREKGMVDQADMLSAWHRRQPKREDDSSPRVRAFRERQKGETQGNAHVTQGNAHVTQGNAHVTQGNGRTEQNRTEQSRVDRATRLPDDFSLTPERRLVAEAERLPAERTFAKFCDYWRAVPGAKGRKLDWDATWRNWCRSDKDRGNNNNGSGQRRVAV